MNEHYDKRNGWVIKTTFRESGDDAWWSETLGPWWDQHSGLTPRVANALFFADEAQAHETAHRHREAKRIGDYSVEPYRRPKLNSDQRGSSGRA